MQVVPTFHSIGLYWTPQGGGESLEATVRFRVVGAVGWNEGLPLWFDKRDGEYRGCIVQLIPGARYEIQLTLQGIQTSVNFEAKTWSEHFPIGETVYLPEYSAESLVIDRAGSPDGYILYTYAPGSSATIDVQYQRDANIEVT